MATPKQAHALVTYFGKRYKEKYGVAAKLNRYAARWGFDSMLMDMDEDEVRGLIDYYFATINPSGHTLDNFLYNYEKLAEAKENTDEDVAALNRIREATRKRTEEWRKRQSGNN